MLERSVKYKIAIARVFGYTPRLQFRVAPMKNNLFHRVTCVASPGLSGSRQYSACSTARKKRAPRASNMIFFPRANIAWNTRCEIRVCNPNVLQEEGRKTIWKKRIGGQVFSAKRVSLTCWALYIAFTTRDHRARRHHRATSLYSLKERKRRRPYIAVVVVPYRSTHTGLWAPHRSNRIVASYDRSSIIHPKYSSVRDDYERFSVVPSRDIIVNRRYNRPSVRTRRTLFTSSG